MEARFKFGKIRHFVVIPTVLISHNPYYRFWTDWAIELHIFKWGIGVNFYSTGKEA